MEIYFAGLIFAVLLHPRIPRKFPHAKLTATTVYSNNITVMIECVCKCGGWAVQGEGILSNSHLRGSQTSGGGGKGG